MNARLPTRAAVFSTLSKKIQQIICKYPSIIRIPIQWGDIDSFGHLNNVQYAKLMESGRIAYFEQVMRSIIGDANFHRCISGQGIATIVKQIAIAYKAPSYFPDNLIIATRVKMDTLSKDRFTQECLIVSESQERIVSSGETVVVCFDYEKGAKAEIPQTWLIALNADEYVNISSKL